MAHLPHLISDLALILIAAGVVTILFRKLRQPVVLGYIIAGFLVSPHVPLFPTILDTQNISVWAEIGVIFLLFALGLEFSFKKLLRVGGAASITAVFEVAGMVCLGFATGKLFGWSNMDSLFLGGILAISSTTIIIRAFEELGVKSRGFVSLVFGVLIVEDLVAILLMVLLSTVANSSSFAGPEMVQSIFKLVFFLTIWFISGIFLLPSFLRWSKAFINEETLLVVSVGLCFIMVVLASQAGFSPALGAFIMGSILAETTEAEKIEHVIKPVKDLFGAVFFVSVGMLINPKLIIEHAGPILVITFVTVFGKLMTTMIGSLLSGQSLRHSLQAGFSLAQIGEFSFIIASLGLTLKVTSEFLYPVAVGVSVLTTFATPYLIRSADPAYEFLKKHMPKRWYEGLERYSSSTRGLSTSSDWSYVLRSYAVKIGLNGVIIASLFLGLKRFLPEILSAYIANSKLINGLSLTIALLCSAPFFWALVMSRVDRDSIAKLWKNRRFRLPLVTLEIVRFMVAIILFGALAPSFVTLKTALGITAGIGVLMLALFSRFWKTAYNWFEERFLKNLSERDRMEADTAGPQLAPWDAHITKMDVPPESAFVGRKLGTMNIREQFGVTIAMIERGSLQITAPSRDDRLYPMDKVSVIGTDEQIARFKEALAPVAMATGKNTRRTVYSLEQHHVEATSPFVNKTIRESGIRESTSGLVVGIEREGKRILNPDSMIQIKTGDALWIVGDRDSIRGLN